MESYLSESGGEDWKCCLEGFCKKGRHSSCAEWASWLREIQKSRVLLLPRVVIKSQGRTLKFTREVLCWEVGKIMGKVEQVFRKIKVYKKLVDILCYRKGFPGGLDVKRICRQCRTWVWSLSREDPLEKEMATHSRILAWRTPWTEEPGGLQSIGLQSPLGDNWVSNTTLLLITCCVCVCTATPTLGDPMDCSPPGSSVHGILQARILEWVAISFSRGLFLTKGSNPCLLSPALAGRFNNNSKNWWGPPRELQCIYNVSSCFILMGMSRGASPTLSF